MNNSIGLRIAKYKAIVKNTEGDRFSNGVTEYPITEEQYVRLKIAIDNKTPFTWLCDLDGKQIREINAKRDIREFKPVTYSDSHSKVQVLCKFGVRHNRLPEGGSNCKCEKKYGCWDFQFLDRLNEALGLEITRSADITERIRDEYLLTLDNTGTT